MPFVHRNWHDIGAHSAYKTNFLVIDEHCGTHFDAAPHFIPPEGSSSVLASPLGSKGGDQADLTKLCGPAAVIDVRSLAGAPGQSPWITVEHIRDWENRHRPLAAGDIVLFASGWAEHYRSGAAGRAFVHGPVVEGNLPGWPAPEVAAILYLADRGIVTVGTEAPSLGAVQDGAPVHQIGLGRGMHYVEGLCNLSRLPALGAWFIFLPLKVVDSTGCPGRAIALLPEEL
jgi:kynurenine formamidase